MRVFVLLLSFWLVGCVSVDTSKIKNLNQGEILNIGHAGLGFESVVNPFNPYPSNSFISLSKALENGADGLEVDVQLSADGEWILFHDLTLDKVTNLSGCIRHLNSHEILGQPYVLGGFFDMFQSEAIISLDSLIGYMVQLDPVPHLQLDVRAYSPCDSIAYADLEEIGQSLIDYFNKSTFPDDKLLIISTNTNLLRQLKESGMGGKLSYEETEDFQRGIDRVLELGIESLTIKRKLLTNEHVDLAHAQGIEVVTFGAKSRSGNAELVRFNPDVIQTNNVKALKSLLE